jgi:predicted DNA binding CopG/RHH family protein
MKKKLRTEEQEVLASYENDEWTSAPHFGRRKSRLQDAAKATLRKDRRVNIRISERDLRELQRKAVHEGLPYQTLISSVLHKFANGSLVDRLARS